VDTKRQLSGLKSRRAWGVAGIDWASWFLPFFLICFSFLLKLLGKRGKKEGFQKVANRFEIRFQKLDLLPEIIFKGLQTFLV
jgi:hypothetical protein